MFRRDRISVAMKTNVSRNGARFPAVFTVSRTMDKFDCRRLQFARNVKTTRECARDSRGKLGEERFYFGDREIELFLKTFSPRLTLSTASSTTPVAPSSRRHLYHPERRKTMSYESAKEVYELLSAQRKYVIPDEWKCVKALPKASRNISSRNRP